MASITIPIITWGDVVLALVILGYLIHKRLEIRRREFFLVGWFEKGEVVWKDAGVDKK